MKRFTVPCDFNGVKHPFHVYIGEPHPKKHPLQFQAWWLSTERGGTIPQDVMDSFEKLFKISQENNVSFEDLCVYALGTAAEENAEAQAASTGSLDQPADHYDDSAYQDDYAAPMDSADPYAPQSDSYNPIENNPVPPPVYDDNEFDSFTGSDDYRPASDYAGQPSGSEYSDNPYGDNGSTDDSIPPPYKPDKDGY